MKKTKCFLFFAALILIISAQKSFADAEGNLTLDSNVITNKTNNVGGSSEFTIRSRLFSQELEGEVNKRETKERELLSSVQSIDFGETHMNHIYGTNIQDTKAQLFKGYSKTESAISESEEGRQRTYFIFFVALILPLVALSHFIAKRRIRRKKK